MIKKANDIKLNGEEADFLHLMHWCECKRATRSMKLVSKFTLLE